MNKEKILRNLREGISFQRSEQVDGEWINTTIAPSLVEASVLPKDENDQTPSVFYNMWVQVYSSEEEFDLAKSHLHRQGLEILTTNNSIYTHMVDGEEVANRFMIVESDS